MSFALHLEASQHPKQLSQQVSALENRFTPMQDQAYRKNHDGTSILTTMVGGRYTDAIRTRCMSLLWHNGGIHRVRPVINYVLVLADTTSIRNMRMEGHGVSLVHLAQLTGSDVLSTLSIRNMLLGRGVSMVHPAQLTGLGDSNTLHFNGTTKESHNTTALKSLPMMVNTPWP